MQEKRITVQDVKQNEKLAVLIDAATRMLEVIGYTEHGPRHVGFVSHTARSILEQLHYPERMCELAAIAGWVHDVGNAVNRVNHGITGGALLFPILQEMGMPMDEVVTIVGAVGNHEEQNGKVVSAVSAALIIADKSDAHLLQPGRHPRPRQFRHRAERRGGQPRAPHHPLCPLHGRELLGHGLHGDLSDPHADVRGGGKLPWLPV